MCEVVRLNILSILMHLKQFYNVFFIELKLFFNCKLCLHLTSAFAKTSTFADVLMLTQTQTLKVDSDPFSVSTIHSIQNLTQMLTHTDMYMESVNVP